MNFFNLSGYNSQTKIYLGLLAALSAVSLGFAFWGFLSFAPIQFAILAVAITIACIVNQYQPRIQKIKTNVSAQDIVIFWGIIWLGVSGGIILSLASSIAAYKFYSKNKGRWLATIFSSVFSTFVAAQAFYLFLNKIAGFTQDHISMHEISFGWLPVGFVLMAAVHFISYTTLLSVFTKIESEFPVFSIVKEKASGLIVNYAVGIIVAIGLHLAFLAAGLSLGLFLLPIAIIVHLAYQIHFKKLDQKTKEITESSRIHLATVEALATAIDARDQVGVGHVRRTQIYAVGIGELLGLNTNDIDALRTGALLHDIGKLGVPDHILNKPGRLTPAEMEKMKIHSTVGASILEKVNFASPVVPTVKYHHEAWDGSGYPEGLKKEQIPLTARIMTIADAYDTLRGARPYRAAIPREDARKFLLSGAGTQFDPTLVDVFLRNLRQFELEIEAEGLAYEFDDKISDLFMGNEGTAADMDDSYVEQIKRANREVFALYELARVFSASLNLQDTLGLFVKKISELMPFHTCAVYLMDKTQEFAVIKHVEGQNADELKGKKVKVGEGATGYVLKKRQAVYNINPALDFSFSHLSSLQEYTAMASLPLIADEKLVGAISIYSCDLESYQDEHMRLLETVSRIASDAISKSIHHAETETHALTDPMTNLPNARSLQMHFENEAARAKRSDTEFQLIMLDLDGFKKVNDTFGHKVGDLLLKEVSKVMRGQLREYDFLARYAGDEFVAIVPETSSEEIQELCDRMEKAVLGFTLPIGDGRFARVGVSMGAASFPHKGETLDQVIIAADQAMYSVKATHKQKQQAKAAPAPVSVPIQTEPVKIEPVPQIMELTKEAFVVELDESHIVSTAIN